MAILKLTVTGVRRILREIDRVEREIQRIHWRALTRSVRDVTRLYKRTLQDVISERTTRRTGRLLRVRIRARRNRSRGEIRLVPDFPATSYRTPPGRGRGGASKIGQYAFVLNHRREFIQEANRRINNDPQLVEILRKHLRFIVNEVNQGR